MPRVTTPAPLHSGQAVFICAAIALRMKALLLGSLFRKSASSASTLNATTAVLMLFLSGAMVLLSAVLPSLFWGWCTRSRTVPQARRPGVGGLPDEVVELVKGAARFQAVGRAAPLVEAVALDHVRHQQTVGEHLAGVEVRHRCDGPALGVVVERRRLDALGRLHDHLETAA